MSWLRAPSDPRDLSAWTLERIGDAGWIMSLQSADVDGNLDLVHTANTHKSGKPGIAWVRFDGAFAGQGSHGQGVVWYEDPLEGVSATPTAVPRAEGSDGP